MPISPISPTGPMRVPGGPGAVAGTGKTNGTNSFSQMLKGQVDQIDKSQQVSASAIKDFLAGKTNEVLPVVSAIAKADLSFKLLIGVRNKVIEAYKQTMNMQI